MSTYVLTVNNESSSSHPSIVIFQENDNEPWDIATAWKVFRPFDSGRSHRFEFSNDFEIAFKDSWGNFTARRKAMPGKQYAIVKSSEGSTIVEKDSNTDTLDSFEVQNEFLKGSVDCLLYRSGFLFAEAKELAPNMKAAFHFKPNLYIGIVSGIKEGDLINTDDAQNNYTNLNIEGAKTVQINYTEENHTTKPATGSFNIIILE